MSDGVKKEQNEIKNIDYTVDMDKENPNTELKPSELINRCNPRQFNFNSTAELDFEEDAVGQERAIEAIEYGLDIPHKGYNIYVMGPPGLGKHTLARKLLERKSQGHHDCFDWCYVYSFNNTSRPQPIRLPKGKGKQFENDMNLLIEQFSHQFSENIALEALSRLQNKYQENDQLKNYFKDLNQHINNHTQDFLRQSHNQQSSFSQLRVNLLVDNSETAGSPVIYEDNPIYYNLTGRVENQLLNGTLITDYSLIRPGSLHRANNGFLMLDIYEVLTHNLAWEALKRALHTNEIRIEPLEQSMETLNSPRLEPLPIPLDIKVVLIGDRETYHVLSEDEPDFKELFRVIADFNNDIPRDKQHNIRYAKMISGLAKADKLKPLDPSAVCRVIDYSSRIIGDSKRLTANIHDIKNIIQQADYWATTKNTKVISKDDIQEAIDRRQNRLNRLQLKMEDEIHRNIILIDTDGAKVGQVNALTVIEFGKHEFGQPSKVTAAIHVGDGDITNIQREVDLSGPIHSKGMLTLIGYLKHRFKTGEKLPITASLSFEQLYGQLDGDSASAAELCALLSALADVPIKQTYGITGSVNQFGDIQSIHSVNEKIEGFYRLCSTRTLTGDQGVIIPVSNVQHLMLSEDVIHAVKKKKFHIHAISHVDQAIEILTGVPAGVRTTRGGFSKDSINHKVEYCLYNYAKCLKARRS